MSEMTKILRSALVATASVAGLFLAGTTVSAQAKTVLPGSAKSAYWGNQTSYVRLKKTMDVGILKKSGKTYRPLIKKKGSLLAVQGMGGAANDKDQAENIVIRAAFSSGAVHYNRQKNLNYQGKISIPFTKANFKSVKLKAPDRTLLFQKGTGFKTNGKYTLKTPSAFYLTLDNYLQAYSASAMKKVAPGGGVYQMTANELWKPTYSTKVSKVTVKGAKTTIDYKKPIKGLPNKKVAKNHYRLTIQKLKGQHTQWFFPVDDTYDAQGTWTNYKVNGKRYFVGRFNQGLD